MPIEENFEEQRFRSTLTDFEHIARDAAPEQLQKLLRLTVKNIKWHNDGTREVDFYIPLTKTEKPLHTKSMERFDIMAVPTGLMSNRYF